MTVKKLRPAPLAKVAGPGVQPMPIVRSSEDSAPLPSFQACFLAARFGLGATRARLTAELAWGRT